MDWSSESSPADATTARGRRLSDWIREYRNDRSCNTAVYRTFAELAHEPRWLDEHLDWVEANDWGSHDLASHHMWRLILEHLSARDGPVRCLEIGVFKGPVISLWTLIGAQLGFAVEVTALGPFWRAPLELTRLPAPGTVRGNVSPLYRHPRISASVASNEYVADCKRIFDRFGLDFCDVEAVRGFSSDETVLRAFEGRSFDLIFIDGAHSEVSARRDVANFAAKVARGGLLVMGHASLSLEMDVPYRGLFGPSRAADGVCVKGFRNILNVGHNRIFQKA